MTDPTLFEKQLQQDLRAQEDHTQAPEVFRLAQARRRALSQEKTPESSFLWPATGISLVSLLLVGVMLNGELGPSTQQDVSLQPSSSPSATSDEALLYATEDYIEVYQDLDFYYWLADVELDNAS